MDRPRGVGSRHSSPSVRDYGSSVEWLCRRFAATIPLQRPVSVTHHDIMLRGDVLVSVGLPYAVKEAVIYLKRGLQLTCIPKACIINIEGISMTEKQPMATDHPRYGELKEHLAAGRNRVRVEHLALVPDDPALPEDLRKSGLPTFTEGRVLKIDDDHLTLSSGLAGVSHVIGRDRIVDITLLGPVDFVDEAEDKVGTKDE